MKKKTKKYEPVVISFSGLKFTYREWETAIRRVRRNH